MIVCSNLGPTMALSLGCWLRLQMLGLFGACSCLFFSPSSGLSTSGLSQEPWDDVYLAFVSATLGTGGASLGLLAGTSSTGRLL